MPGFNDDLGNVSLLSEGLFAPVLLDEVTYSEDWHHSLLDDEEGVSLEKINSSAVSQSSDSWHSAAETAGFATPTAINSQLSDNSAPSEEIVTLENETFSPDNDGYKDFLIININPGAPDYLANIKVLDVKGRVIKNLSRNVSLASSDLIKWEGDNIEGNKAKIGIYIIWVELFNPDGNVEYYKKRCVLAAKLN